MPSIASTPSSAAPAGHVQRLQRLLRAWELQFTPQAELVQQIGASPLWQQFMHPSYPVAGAVLGLAENAIVLASPFTLDINGSATVPYPLADCLGVVHPDDAEAFVRFFEAQTDPQRRMLEVSVRYLSGNDNHVWLLLMTAPLLPWFEGAEGYRLLIVHNITTLRSRREANLVSWSNEGRNAWTTLYPEPVRLSTPLSPRELEVLGYLAKGWGSRRIAEQLGLSTYTVDTHRSNMLLKTGCSNTPDLVRFALEQGLV